ncbi:MAG: cation-translocating P-type ATPase [Defluviitaleaceae bacterium]|nr:cation-translocating P-type ATPase [Defluviitaleaceae bacterium]
MLWVKDDINEIIQKQNTNITTGLTSAEVTSRQTKYGLNEFEEGKKETLWQKILHHLLEIPTLILIAAAIIATIAAVMNAANGTGSVSDWVKVAVILLIVLINIALGLYQEAKTEKALDALKKMNSFKTTVIRGGVKQVIDANQLVPGDIVEINTGDVITADSRLIEASSLQVEEAALTGESHPVDKNPHIQISEDVPLGDRLNMVYSGCLVTGGRGLAVVVETAMETEMGKIAKLLNTTEKLTTPLQKRLKQLAKNISIAALLAGAAMFVVGSVFWGNPAIEMLLLAVALGVAAVPEILPVVVTMILSYGVFNMAKKKAIIRKIPAIETLGNTSVICSDKTGTLTMNKMVIQRFWHASQSVTQATEEFCEKEIRMLEMLASCSNATIEVHGDEDEHVVGDPTEIAIIRLLHDKGLTRVDAERMYPRVYEIPFDSGRKRMTTVHHVNDGYLVITKGAFDRLPVKWDEGTRQLSQEIHDSFADKALRVIAIGTKHYKEMPADLSEAALERDLQFVGLVGMIDPPRPESKEAVAKAKEAGIKTVMITGDHIATAVAIAREIGIMNEGDRAVTGAELALMSEVDLRSQVRGISVYARVSPEDKLRIVKAWEFHNEVVTMTGDGVNDAPALKAADVGVAMGITGTEVTKSAADMIITDDNFATIVDAIAEGRTSYDNVRKIIKFLLGVNFAEIFILLAGMLIIGRTTITALQILLINVVFDGIPGFFLAFEPSEPGVMRRKPLPKGSGVFAGGMGVFIGTRALMFSVITLTGFFIGAYVNVSSTVPVYWSGDLTLDALRYQGNWGAGITMAFLVLSLASVISIFNVRTRQSIFKVKPWENMGLFISTLGAVGFMLLVALVPPLAAVFGLASISIWHWLIVVGLSVAQVLVFEVVKLFMKGK